MSTMPPYEVCFIGSLSWTNSCKLSSRLQYPDVTCADTRPVLHDHFRNGGSSVQLKNENPFATIAVDQTTEDMVNTDTQTVGGTRGFTIEPGAVSRYYLTP